MNIFQKLFGYRSKLAAVLLVLGLGGCSTVARGPFPLPSDPAVETQPTFLDCWWSAEIFAYQENGHVYEIEPKGSMVPTLLAKDLVVIAPKPFAEFVPYKIALYDAEWLPISSPDCIHRIVGRDARGLIMQGDAAPFPESEYRVTEGRAKGILIGIWRIQP